MTQDNAQSAAAQARARHAALVEATLATVEALPRLSPDATPLSFQALKAAPSPEGAE